MEDNERILGDLWVDKLARITGMEKLGQKIFNKNGMGAYLYIWVFQIINELIWRINLIKRHGRQPISDYYYTIVILLGLTFGVWALKKIKIKYEYLLKYIEEKSKGEIKNLENGMYRYSFLILGSLLFLFYTHTILDDYILSIGYLPTVIHNVLKFFIYIPLMVELIACISNIHLDFPIKFKKITPKIDFSDPFHKSGLDKIGSLFLYTTEIYFIGMTIYSLMPFYNYFTGIGNLSLNKYILMINLTGWIIGLFLFFLPQLWIHKYIKKKKKKKVKEIYNEMKEIGEDDESFPEVFPDDPDEMVQYMHSYHKLQMIHSQSEYPFDMAKVRELFAIAVIPLGLEVLKLFLF